MRGQGEGGSVNVGRPSLSPEKMLVFLQEHVYRWAGYTHETAGPRVTWRRQAWIARRLLVTLLSGRQLRDKDCVFDTCGNRKCMTLAHLKVGTHAQAHQQRVKEGAYLAGARRSLIGAMSRAKTSRMGIDKAPAVLELREQGWTYKQIGERYGVTGAAVGHALAAWRRAGITEWRAVA